MDEITVERHGHVAAVVIDRPPNNHVSVSLIAGLADHLEALDADHACRAVVLASQGKVFCGGADLSPSGPDGDKPGAIASDLYRQAERLFRTRKPIVAAVQGAAVGAGLGLALVADFRVVAAEARFSANFVKLGFHSGFAISLTLPRLIGLQKASLMLQTGRRVAGEDAMAMGLADELVPLEKVRSASIALAQEIAANAPLAVQSLRATLRGDLADQARAQMAHELAEQSVQRQTSDFAEGVRAVAERRAGAFTGR